MTVIAEHGIARTTHRLIAAAADVPLGSLTYHFASLQDLCRQAFERQAEQMSATYAAHFEDVSTVEGLIDALVDLIHGGGDHDDWAISSSSISPPCAIRRSATVTEAWMQASRRVLEQHLDPPDRADGRRPHRRLDHASRSLHRTDHPRRDPYPPGTRARRHPTRPKDGPHVTDISTDTDLTVRAGVRATYAAFIATGFAFASWASRIPQVRDRLSLDPAQLGLCCWPSRPAP